MRPTKTKERPRASADAVQLVHVNAKSSEGRAVRPSTANQTDSCSGTAAEVTETRKRPSNSSSDRASTTEDGRQKAASSSTFPVTPT